MSADDQPAPRNFTARLLTADSAWGELRSDWDRVFAMTPNVTPWQSWDLLSRWWQSQRGTRLLRIVVVERGGVVEMILPLQLSALAPLGLRVLEPVGMPDDINRPRLALGAPDARAFTSALRFLWQRRHEWDAIQVDEKLSDDQEVAWLQELAQSTGSWLKRNAFHPCPYLNLATSWPAYLAARGTRLAKNVRAARRCLESKGAVHAQRFDSAPDVLRAFGVLVDLHERSWKHEARVGLSQSESYRNFYREFVKSQADRGKARAWILSCNSQPVAATLAFQEGTTYFSAQIAHDDAFSKCSPGTLLEAIELEDLFGEGKFRIFDFLGGALNNKLRWTSESRQTERVWVVRKSVRGLLFCGYYFAIKPWIKTLRARLPPQSTQA